MAEDDPLAAKLADPDLAAAVEQMLADARREGFRDARRAFLETRSPTPTDQGGPLQQEPAPTAHEDPPWAADAAAFHQGGGGGWSVYDAPLDPHQEALAAAWDRVRAGQPTRWGAWRPQAPPTPARPPDPPQEADPIPILPVAPEEEP